MDLQTLVDGIKEDTQIGAIGNNADQAALDIIRHLNLDMHEVYDFAPWPWSLSPINFVIPAGTTGPVTISGGVKEIVLLGIQGQTGELEHVSYRSFRDNFVTSEPVPQVGDVVGYYDVGLDANSNIKIQHFYVPQTDTNIEGLGKLALSELAAGQIAVGFNIPVFPPDVVRILYDLGCGRLWLASKDSRGVDTLKTARRQYADLWSRLQPQDKNTRCKVPESYAWRKRRRGGPTVV